MTLHSFGGALALVAALGALAACAGDDEEAGDAITEPPSGESVSTEADAGAAMRLTLTDDGCTYEGPEMIESGAFTAEVENRTEFFAAFSVAGIAEGSTIADLESFVAEAKQTFEETGTLPEPPAHLSQAVRSGVEAGQTGSLPADVAPGTYALMCFVDDLPTWRGYVAGELVVSG